VQNVIKTFNCEGVMGLPTGLEATVGTAVGSKIEQGFVCIGTKQLYRPIIC